MNCTTIFACVNDEIYMKRCLEVASNGIGLVQQNPSVGAVIVFDDTIIGEGYHHQYGSDHAEICAIKNVPKSKKHLLSKATMYVSLEPCSHQGKTPSCAKKLIELNFKRVVIAQKDPNKLVAGKGIQMLVEKGIEVEVGVLESEARYFHRRFLSAFERKRPYVILKWAQTMNGYFMQDQEQQHWISGAATQYYNHKLRAAEGAILVGANTAIADNPALTARVFKGHQPIVVLIDPKLRVPKSAQLFKASQVLVFNRLKSETLKNVTYIQIDFEKQAEIQVLNQLHEYGIQSVIIEGGCITLQRFIDLQLWDEAFIFQSKKVRWESGICAPNLLNTQTLKEIDLPEDIIVQVANTTNEYITK